MKKSHLFMSSAALAAAAAFIQPVFAQVSPAPVSPDSETEVPSDEVAPDAAPSDEATYNETAIVITGSRIARPNLDSSIPITSLTADELTNTGNFQVGDRLNELPAFRSTFSQANSTRFIGTAGLNLLDLRGLGTSRTLVLINGRRHVTSSPGGSSVDTNTIPNDLIERVDTVTGGNSAIYGSEAVAGVVNFILKRDFEGVRLKGQGGISSRGDRGSYFASLTAGKNFNEDRGNVAVSLEFTRSQPLFFTQRDEQTGAYSGRNQFNLVQNTAGEEESGDGMPDREFQTGIRNINISEGGAYVSSCPADMPENAARRALNCTGIFSTAGRELGRGFVFDSAGNLIPNIGTRDFRPFGSNNNTGGIGSTLRLTGMLQPGIKRYAGNVLAHYDFSDAFRPFIEAKYVRVEALQEGQPTFHFNRFSLDNPFLTEQARGVLAQSLAPDATSLGAFRFNIDFGGRGEEHVRETYRIVAGVEGTFNDDWRYEVSLNYGRTNTFYTTNGNILEDEFANARDAERNSAGQIVCAINNDEDADNDDAACVPVNLFGNGAVSQAALNYFGFTSSREENANQYNATAYVSGDLSQLFEFPGGPIGFAVGIEYRRETAFSAFDPITQSGATFLNSIPTFDPPAQVVKEAFGEIRIPLLADRPFANELTIEAAGRFSDYKLGNIGSVFAYNVNGTYSPFPGLRFRAGYAKSVRAPDQDDLLSSPSQTFLNGLADPCGEQNINENPNRVANCAADGVPTTQTFGGTTEPFTNRPSSGVSGLNGSNPLLSEESGKSLTIGMIAEPAFIPGLSISVDYYDITVTDAIFSLGAQTIIDQCYDSPSGINNSFCEAITRNPNGTFAGQSDVQHGGASVSFETTGSAFTSGPFNFAKLETSGIDAELNYTRQIGSIGLSLRSIVSYVINRDDFTDINRPDFIDQALHELGDPQWEGSLRVGLDFGKLELSYRFRYIGIQAVDDYEATHSVQGRPPENPDGFSVQYYPAVTYSDIRASFDVGEKFNLYAGVDNVFDKLPAFGLTGTGGGSGIYDNIGRFIYFGAEVNF